jgi:hypothetical protein
MKGWIEVTDPEADWVGLAREAWRVAAGAGDGLGDPQPMSTV